MIRRILGLSGQYKQVILVRTDLKMPKGKLAAQVAHASVNSVISSRRMVVSRWLSQGGKKIVLKVKGIRELRKYHASAIEIHMVSRMITDAGHTTLRPGTVTCCGIGPDKEYKIDQITGKLKML